MNAYQVDRVLVTIMKTVFLSTVHLFAIVKPVYTKMATFVTTLMSVSRIPVRLILFALIRTAPINVNAKLVIVRVEHFAIFENLVFAIL